MRHSHVAAASLSLAPWVLAGSLLLGEGAPVSAQDATPAPLEVSTETREASAESQAEAVGGESAPSAMPSAGVGGGFTLVVHEAVVPVQLGSAPPMLTVAVTL